MIRGSIDKDIINRSWKIALFNDDTQEAVTFEFKVEKVAEQYPIPTTDIRFQNNGLLLALATVLQEAGIMPKTSDDAELRATKYHLEDMRKLAIEEMPQLRKWMA